MTDRELSPVEAVKARSRHLRGTLQQSLADPLTGAVREDDVHLVKFHGLYQQDDRDLRLERRAQRLEPAWQFMIRARVPAGRCSAAQWLAMDSIARQYANGTLRLTTRQAFQFHGVLKRDLKRSIASINQALFDTLAACGDVNRNVMATTLPRPPMIRAEIDRLCRQLSERFTPRSRAYHEIWLDESPVVSTANEQEPLYGDTYLPRKFKMGIAVPPDNDIDVYAQDLGFIATVEDGELSGFNVAVGGGLGTSHGDFSTYPRLASVIGWCTPAAVLQVAEAVLTAQRDLGDRVDRRHARLKYTIERMGLPAFKAEVERRAGMVLSPARSIGFAHHGDRFGWHEDEDGQAHYTVQLPGGRVADSAQHRALSGLRAIAETARCEFHLTPNQNVVLANVAPGDRSPVGALLQAHGLDASRSSPVRRLALACVGLPTCGLAMAESERALDPLVTRIETLLAAHGLSALPLTLRITGCPNGCARPFLAEIALIGKAPGRYDLLLGGAPSGTRLNALYAETLDADGICARLDPLFMAYARERQPAERFGDFVVRTGIVPAITSGPGFAAVAAEVAAGRGRS